MNPSDYTLETFIDTPANQLAHLAAQKICETPGAYSPLYLWPARKKKVITLAMPPQPLLWMFMGT